MGTVFALPRSRHARTVLMCGKLQGELSKVSTRGRLLCCCEANIQELSSCAANCKENFRRLAHKVTVLLCRLRGSRKTVPVCSSPGAEGPALHQSSETREGQYP